MIGEFEMLRLVIGERKTQVFVPERNQQKNVLSFEITRLVKNHKNVMPGTECNIPLSMDQSGL